MVTRWIGGCAPLTGAMRETSSTEAGTASPDGVRTPLAFERQPTVMAVPLDGRRSLHDPMAPLALDDCCSEPTA